MRSLGTLIAIGMALSTAVGGPAPTPAPADAGHAVVVEKGDRRWDTAQDCLAKMLTAESEYGRTDLRVVLQATGFSLSKVTVREVKQDPPRIRFGFEFDNREQVKTLYWEADCPAEGLEGAPDETRSSD
jgi:hypothetical protein